MRVQTNFPNLGISQYEITAYLSLVAKHPLNGSQLSKQSRIPRARIYDVLQSLRDRGMVVEMGDGLYVPLPPEELLKRLRHRFDTDLSALEKRLDASQSITTYDYMWTIQGYAEVINKAKEMVSSATTEIYIRLFPEEGQVLAPDLHRAASRGVEVKYISMGRPSSLFHIQVIHPEAEKIVDLIGGRSIDIVVDRKEVLVGIFEKGKEDHSSINWTKNYSFVVADRDSLRHDFYHCFLYKMVEKKRSLSEKEKRLYELIKNDA